MQPKQYFIKKLANLIDPRKEVKILEMGCGQAKNILPILQKFPAVQYVGIEPQKREFERAKNNLADWDKAKIYNQLGYEMPAGEKDFDVCFSLSVLEHVKDLEKLLTLSITAVKPGGHIIHWYDLGHALYPSSNKEKIQLSLSRYFKKVWPEEKYVAYIDVKNVCRIMEKNGAKIQKITYHQMPDHKAFLKLFDDDTEEKKSLAEEILAWEDKVSLNLKDWEQKSREKLFPTVCVWAVKK